MPFGRLVQQQVRRRRRSRPIVHAAGCAGSRISLTSRPAPDLRSPRTKCPYVEPPRRRPRGLNAVWPASLRRGAITRKPIVHAAGAAGPGFHCGPPAKTTGTLGPHALVSGGVDATPGETGDKSCLAGVIEHRTAFRGREVHAARSAGGCWPLRMTVRMSAAWAVAQVCESKAVTVIATAMLNRGAAIVLSLNLSLARCDAVSGRKRERQHQ